jgi:hypothetical protein
VKVDEPYQIIYIGSKSAWSSKVIGELILSYFLQVTIKLLPKVVVGNNDNYKAMGGIGKICHKMPKDRQKLRKT